MTFYYYFVRFCRFNYFEILDKQTFPDLSQAMRQLVLDVEMSLDLGNPVRTFTSFCSSTSHIRTVPSHDDDAWNCTQQQKNKL